MTKFKATYQVVVEIEHFGKINEYWPVLNMFEIAAKMAKAAVANAPEGNIKVIEVEKVS
jgi:hypothetical protein